MKRKNSLRLLYIAAKNTKHTMWASLKVLIVATLVLSIIFYFVERDYNAEHYSIWKSLLWSFTRYIGDPGMFGGNGPVTYEGRIVATLLAIVKILIFAVPAGLLGSGFKSAIEEENREMELVESHKRLQKAFRRIYNRSTGYHVVSRRKPIATIQADKKWR